MYGKGSNFMKKAALHNLGCKVNAYEMEAMREMLEENGYEIVPFRERADVYIVNTCTVTNIADRKSRQMLHRARKTNPEAIVVAAGCYAQVRKSEMDETVDIIIGNNRKKDLIGILDKYQRDRRSREFVQEELSAEYEKLRLSRTAEHVRAYLKVQDGCNQFCSYCIIPYARGRVRSRSPEDVANEVRALAANGYKEIVLTGIHLSSYGIDCQSGLLPLIRTVHEIDGIQRIRLGSLEPGIITEEFVRSVSELPKVCPHFHLSLQSGCDRTLRRMNRKYTAREYYEKCELLRKYFEFPAITTDVIVGFPQETDEEFEESRKFIDKVDFYETHIFKYSRREGTKAAAMENQVPEEVKAARSSELIELGRKKREKYESFFIGRTVEVLMEETVSMQDGVYQTGHTREYVKIGLKTTENLTNQLINVAVENRLQIMH